MTPRNLFSTTQVKAYLTTGIAIIALSTPYVGDIIKRRSSPRNAADIDSVVAIITGIAGLFGAGGIVAGLHATYKADDNLYTPDGMAGRNLSDFSTEENSGPLEPSSTESSLSEESPTPEKNLFD